MEKTEGITIAHGSDSFPGAHDIWGGAELAARRIAQLLEGNRGISQLFITLPSPRQIEGFKSYQPHLLEEIFPKAKGIISYMKDKFPYDPFVRFRVSKILRSEHVDIMHLHKFDFLSFSMVCAAKKLNIPVIFSLYDLWAVCPKNILMDAEGEICTRYHGPWCAHCMGTLGILQRLSRRFRRPFFSHFLKKIDRFLVLSETVRRNLTQVGIAPNKIEILPLPLLFEGEGTPSGRAEPDSFLFVGWINSHKGLHILVEAIGMVKVRIPGIRLYVVETGEDTAYKNKVVQRIEELSLKEKVTFLGKRSNEEVRQYLSMVSGVIVPEQWGIAWPIFLTEAMYYARPIVASRIGDIPSFIRDGETGYLAEARNPVDFAEKIVKILQEPERAEAMAKKARQYILDVTDREEIAEKLLGIYREVLKERVKR